MVYGRNLHPGSVINHHTHGWAVVDRVEPFGPGSTHADVWLVGVDKAIKVGIASSARRSPALRSTAALARKLWAEVRRLRSELETAERERDAIQGQFEAAMAGLIEIDKLGGLGSAIARRTYQAIAAVEIPQDAAARHRIGGNDHG